MVDSSWPPPPKENPSNKCPKNAGQIIQQPVHFVDPRAIAPALQPLNYRLRKVRQLFATPDQLPENGVMSSMVARAGGSSSRSVTS